MTAIAVTNKYWITLFRVEELVSCMKWSVADSDWERGKGKVQEEELLALCQQWASQVG